MALIPLAYLLFRTAQGGLGAWVEAVATERTARLATTSLLLAGVVTAACLVIGVASAWLVTRSNTPGRRAFAVLLALPLAVPSYVAAFTWVSVADLWTATPGTRFEGFVAAAVVLTLYTYPYVYLPVAAALVRADPAQEEVARSLGRGPLHTVLTVTLPQVRPAVVGGGLLAALYVLADFGAVSILRLDTFTRAIFTAFSAGFNRQGALTLATLLVLVTTVILLLEGRTRRAGARFSGTHVTRPARAADLGVWRWAGAAGLGAVLLAALGVPALSLARWMARGTSAGDATGRLWDAAVGSLTASLLGALLTILLALPLGILAARHPGRLSQALERTAYLAHSLPGVVVGLSLVFFGVTVALPFYQTTWLLALAYATLFLPLGVGAVASAASQAPRSLEEAAAALGRSPAQVFRRVTLPLTLPGIGAGAALVFLTAMKELPATLLLRPTGMDTLATRLWSATAIGRYAEAAPYALVLVALAAVPTWLIVRRTGILPAAGEREPLRPVEVEDPTGASDLLEGVKA
ncbi:ABC transporter permease [Ornithinimicrobium pekingense]|uniref:ABC transporter permease n=1 Tax=Ornithinimicrobium pekingense TaxID=384677 RepID=A0ABQ2FC00_9MICO|nr:iron ABC transporter permease [Ornithinimicrobium pekingense]GGK72784.1 ABC transporter permease [Ornithinimicrobium pekingense]